MSIKNIAKVRRFIDALEGSNAFIILLALKKIKEATIKDIQIEIAATLRDMIYPSSVKHRLMKFIEQGLVEETNGKFKLTERGKELAGIVEEFVKTLEERMLT